MKFFRRLLFLFRKEKLDAEMSEEMRLHLELQTEQNISRGMASEEARYAAYRSFGGIEQVKELCREQRAFPGEGLHLFRHGYVSVRRSPLLALTIVGTLGIALAACVLVFSFLNTFLFRPLPYGDAARLAVIYEHSLKGGPANSIALTYDNLVAVEERAGMFSRLGILRIDTAALHDGESVEVASLQRVNADVFPLMDARAALGSPITQENAAIDGIRAVVLSDALWRRRFGGDAAVLGRIVSIGDQPHRVVGVMPADFALPNRATPPDAWPALLREDYRPNADTPLRYHIRHFVWGELAPGTSVNDANVRLAALAGTLREQFPKENADRTFMAVPLREDLLGNFGRQLVLLQGAVLLVLVVACFNCLCLLIARALQRRREFAVRLALGASRGHLLAQLFAESLWLALPAGALALLLAGLALPAGIALLPEAAQPSLQALPAPALDATVAAAVIFTAVVIALAFSALPLLQTRNLNLESALREGGRTAGSRGARRAARMLAVGQIAVALALLISAALLGRSQRALQRLEVGLPVGELDLFHVGLRGENYTRDPARRLRLFERFREQLLTLPGVQAVGVASFFLVPPPAGFQPFVQEGDGLELSATPKRALLCSVLPATFSALDLRLREGRLLAETDVAGRPPVAVISASLAARYWPGESPIGKRARLQNLHGAWVEVVGVVADVYGTGNQPRVVDTFYLTIAQAEPPGLGMGFYIRHGGVPPDARAYRRALAQIDPTLQIFGHATPAEIHARAAWQSRFVTRLVAGFAALAVGLAFAGIYAVNSFFVARRIQEFGIRTALGANRRDVFQLVLGDSLRLTLAGLAAGVVLAVAASRSLTGLLYGVPSLDPLVYAGGALLMTAACSGAALLPARRAARVDPITALRAD